MSMDVIRMRCEMLAPDGADWISVRRLPRNGFGFSGSVTRTEPEAGPMMTIIHSADRCAFPALALKSAMAWAESKGSEKLYVIGRREEVRQSAGCA